MTEMKINGFRPMASKLWQKLDRLLFRSCDPTSLAVFRILFGLLMALDIPYERELSIADVKWANQELCRFPLVQFLSPLSYDWMCVIYSIMWLGTMGIALGYHFHFSCLSFLLTYWYVVLLDKATWNNHTYLFGLIGLLLLFTRANVCWSLDRQLDKVTENTVPSWNYVILRFQIFTLYFMAGLKKMDRDWLSGYSVRALSQHWVFDPFKICLSERQIDDWIIHRGGFVIDLFAGFGLCFRKSRTFTLIILLAFHFMNSRIFKIGIFPYMGIATMFIFCDYDWPKELLRKLRISEYETPPSTSKPDCQEENSSPSNIQKYIVILLLTSYAAIQSFLPFSHFITKGYNGWTNGQYGYSWDMMVNSWDISRVVVTIVDKNTDEARYLNSDPLVLNNKWQKHPDMLIQFAHCAKENLARKTATTAELNVSVLVDVWCSLNGRFHQRMFDPRVDLLTARWSPFEKVSWVMPLLTQLSDWRQTLEQIREATYRTSNSSEVIFIADFPGLTMENFVNDELEKVEIQVLKGRIELAIQGRNERRILDVGENASIPSNVFHQISTISSTPSCYMYSYHNKTAAKIGTTGATSNVLPSRFKDEVFSELETLIRVTKRSIHLIVVAVLNIITGFLRLR